MKKLNSKLKGGLLAAAFSLTFTLPASASTIQDLIYTGAVQTFTAPVNGTYQLEVWGASGGKGYINGVVGRGLEGKGGYSRGNVYLEAGQQLYVYIGGYGQTNWRKAWGGFNGGGTADGYITHGMDDCGGGGGGASDIRLGGTDLEHRIIVAGGGGGANCGFDGGDGGGLSGGDGAGSYGQAPGGTQTSGYQLGTGAPASFSYDYGVSGGGGGGYYGGKTYGYGVTGGGGGSGYIGGVIDGTTIAGEYTMPSPAGGTEIGQTGNGYARITIPNTTYKVSVNSTGNGTTSGGR